MNLPIDKFIYLITGIKKDISPEDRAFEGDGEPGIQLTIGADENYQWGYQTGDNSYAGGAYHYPYWGVVGVYADSDARELGADIIEQIMEQIYP